MQYHIRQKVPSLHGVYKVNDESGETVYHVRQKMVSITNRTVLLDAADNELGTIHRKVVSVHSVHYIEMANGEQGEIREQKLLELHDNYAVEGFGWTIQGNVTGHDFSILDAAGNVIAQSHTAYLSIGDSMAVDIIDESQTAKVVAVLITILLIQRDRKTTYVANS